MAKETVYRVFVQLNGHWELALETTNLAKAELRRRTWAIGGTAALIAF
jgi:hypothetical protein